MDEASLKRHRERLLALVAELESALNAGGDMTAVVSLDESIGRLSRIDALHAQEMSLGPKEGHRRRLERARRALDAVARGTYGVCVGCAKP